MATLTHRPPSRSGTPPSRRRPQTCCRRGLRRSRSWQATRAPARCRFAGSRGCAGRPARPALRCGDQIRGSCRFGRVRSMPLVRTPCLAVQRPADKVPVPGSCRQCRRSPLTRSVGAWNARAATAIPASARDGPAVARRGHGDLGKSLRVQPEIAGDGPAIGADARPVWLLASHSNRPSGAMHVRTATGPRNDGP